MSDWKEYKLSDLMEIKYGKDHKHLADGSYPLFGSGGIMRYVEKSIYEEESILIPRKGTLSNLFYVNEPFWSVDTMFWSKIKQDLVLPKYLYYTLKTYNLAELNVGSAVPSLTTEVLNKVLISIPDKNTQTSITEILSSLDDKIELNNKINQELETFAQTLFKQWFIEFEFPNENGEPYKSSGGEMVDSELGEIPKGWKLSSLGSLLELIIDYRGKTPLKLGMNWCENGIKAISARNVKNRSLTNLDNVHIGSQELYDIWMKDELKFGDVLLTSEAPLGETAILLEHHNYILSQRLFALRANNKISPYYLFEYLSSETGKNELERRQSGSTVVGIKQKELLQITLLSPATEIIKHHSALVAEIYKSIENNDIENQELTNLRDTLLPKLISGELELKNAKF